MCGPSTRCVLLWLSLYPLSVWGVALALYVQDEGLRDRVAGGQGVLSFPGVATSAGCALHCNHRPPCASYMIHADTRLCVTCPENCTGVDITFTNASGFRFYKTPADIQETVQCANLNMDPTQESLNIAKISVGPAGVWAVTSEGEVLHRAGTARTPGSVGTAWVKRGVVLLDDIDSGGAVGGAYVTGAERGGAGAWLLTGVSPSCPLGWQWSRVSAVSTLRLSASPGGSLWLLDTNHNLYFKAAGGQWTLTFSKTLYVDAGPAGVYALNDTYYAFYRTGTWEDNDAMGSGWVPIPALLRTISSTLPLLGGVNMHDYFFSQIATDNPAGNYWHSRLNGILHADIYNNALWVIDSYSKVIRMTSDDWW